MDGHIGKGIAILVLILLALYVAYEKFLSPSVSSSVAGVTTPDSAKTLNAAGAAAFSPSPITEGIPRTSYNPGPLPAIDVNNGRIGTIPFPLSYGTQDNSGLTSEDHTTIMKAGTFTI